MSELLLVLNAVYTTIIGLLLKVEHEQYKTQLELARLDCERRTMEACEKEMRERLTEMKAWVEDELQVKEKEIREMEKHYWTEIKREDLEKGG
jgi:chaperonin cofactor prefoldin